METPDTAHRLSPEFRGMKGSCFGILLDWLWLGAKVVSCSSEQDLSYALSASLAFISQDSGSTLSFVRGIVWARQTDRECGSDGACFKS
jgi:hypothetical protein